MASERWSQLEQLFGAAVELPEGQRSRFLDGQCPNDPELRRQVEELLAADAVPERDWTNLTLGQPAGSPSVPGYRELEVLGHGGMATVYRARRHDELFDGKLFAVKVLHAHRLDENGRRRFDFERRMLATLDHPNIVRLYDGGELEDGRPYLVMDYVEGQPIDAYCQERCLSVEQRLRLFQSLCHALQHAHRNLVVHRDLKPGNVLVGDDGVLSLLDFGIAKLLEEGPPRTASQLVPMTPSYASPEQVAGRPVTIASDLYSAGLLLRELVTDSQSEPTEGEGRTVSPRPLRGDLEHIASKALRKEPEERYASAQEFADDIERYLRHLPVHARRGSWRYRAQRFARRHRLGLAVSATAILALGFAIVAGVQSRRLAASGEETLALIREMTDPNEEQVIPAGNLDAAVAGILRLDDAVGSKSVLLALLSRLNVPEGQLLEGAVALFERQAALGEADPGTASVALLLGENLFHANHFEAAEKVLGHSVAIAEAAYGSEASELSPHLELYARLLSELERYEEGVAALARSRALREKFGGDRVGLAQLQLQLSALLYLQGHFEQAVASGRAAMELLDQVGDTTSAVRAAALKGLSVALVELRDASLLEEAETLARESLRISEAVHGLGHMETIHARHNLVTVLGESRRMIAAREVAERNLSIAEESLGPDHPRLAYLLTSLAAIHHYLGHPKRCVEMARRAFELRTAGLPAGSFLTAGSRRRLALCLAEVGRTGEAIEHLKGTIWAFENSRVEDNGVLDATRANLAALLAE